MEMKVFEVIIKYSMLFTVILFVFYIFFNFLVFSSRTKKETLWYHINFELLSIFRSSLIVMISFYVVSYLALVKLGAETYFSDPHNINKVPSDFFKYIFSLSIKN